MDTALGQEWFATSEVATILGVTQRHVERLIASGQLESKRFGPRLRRVSREAIDAFVEAAAS